MGSNTKQQLNLKTANIRHPSSPEPLNLRSVKQNIHSSNTALPHFPAKSIFSLVAA